MGKLMGAHKCFFFPVVKISIKHTHWVICIFITVGIQLLEHRQIVYHGCFKSVLVSLGKT